MDNRHDTSVEYKVIGTWGGNKLIDVRTNDIIIGDKVIRHLHSFRIDELEQLSGEGTAPTAQDYLFAGLAGSMLTAFVTEASVRGISIVSLSLEIRGKLDLKAVQGLKRKADPGFEKLEYRFIVESKAPNTTIYEIANHVIFYSPVYATISKGNTEILRTVEIVS